MVGDDLLFFLAAVVGLAEAESCEFDKGRSLVVCKVTATAAAPETALRKLCPSSPCEGEAAEDSDKDEFTADDDDDDDEAC
jgi:hypothetical protein